MADTLESLEIQVRHSASGAADEINQVASAISNLSSALNRVPAKLRELSAALDMVKGKTSGITINDNQTTQIADNITNVKQAAQGAERATSEAAKGVQRLSNAAAKGRSPLDNFVSSLKRIAFYRFIRSIIKAITQALQEGLQNAYQFSSGMDGSAGRFAAAMDSMKAAGGTMKNQLGAAFISLLAIIAPIVNAIISLITALASALSQLFGAFTGGTWLKATDNAQGLADACGGGAAAAKEWKNQLLGFDEINRLEAPNDGGGGGGGGMASAAGMFEEKELTGFFARLHEKIEELKKDLDFEPLKNAWDKLTAAVERFLGVLEGRFWFLWDTLLVPFAHWTIEEALPLLIEDLALAFDLLSTILEKTEPYWRDFIENFVKPFAEWDMDRITTGLEGIGTVLQTIIDLLNGDITVKSFFENFSLGIGDVTDMLFPFQKIAKEVGDYLAGEFLAIWGETTKALEDLNKALDDLYENIVSSLGNGKLEWQDFGAVIVQVLVAPVDAIKTLIGWIQSLVGWLNQIDFSGIGAASALVGSGLGGFSLFASGGFPDEGQLFIARESGAEMVGTIGNRTAVANNEDIVAAVSQGVFGAVAAAMSGSGNNRHGTIVMNVNGREFMRAVYEDGNAVADEHGISLIMA